MRRDRTWQGPNLAGAPFENQRPIERLAALLWILALVAVAIGAWRFHVLERDSGTKASDLARYTTETASARERATALETELEHADLPGLNQRTEFLNRRLTERAFSWNRLLDRLTETLPRGVRLRTLTPQAFAKETPASLRRGATAAPAAAVTRVSLRLDGQAEDTEALLEFVDRLFAHPEFDQPNLARESEKKDLLIDFDLSVDYLPPGEAADGEAESPAERSAARSVPAASAAEEDRAAAEPGGAEVASPGVGAAPQPRAFSGTPPSPVAPAPGEPAAVASDATRAARPVAPSPVRPGRAFSRSASGEPRAESPGLPDREPDVALPEETPVRSRAGASGAPAAPKPLAYPYNLIPTPLKPYASSAGDD